MIQILDFVVFWVKEDLYQVVTYLIYMPNKTISTEQLQTNRLETLQISFSWTYSSQHSWVIVGFTGNKNYTWYKSYLIRISGEQKKR